MNPEDYNLTKLTEDLEDLDSIEKSDYLKGVCSSLLLAYDLKYDLNVRDTFWKIFNDTSIFCEGYIDIDFMNSFEN